MKKARALILLSFLLITILPFFKSMTVMAALPPSSTPFTMTKYIPMLKFNNQTTGKEPFNITFNSDGSFLIRNSKSDALMFQRPTLTNANLTVSIFNNASFVLQYFRLIGSPYGVNITFNLAVSESSIKMSIISYVATPANLSYAMLASNSKIYKATLNQFLSQDANGSAVGINWNDISRYCFFNQTSAALTVMLASGSSNLDPTLIDSVYGIPEDALVYPYQKRVLSIQGLDWVFYCDSTNMKFKTSYDSWTVSTILSKVDYSFQFDIASNGSDVSYAILNGTDFLYYRRGLANNTGGITWYASIQNYTLSSLSLGNYFPSLEMNSSGYDWLVNYQITGAGAKRDMYFSNNAVNGSWITDKSGVLRGGLTVTDYPIIRAGSSGKMFGLINLNNTADIMRMRLYNGSAWNSTTFSATSDLVNMQYVSVVSNGNILHVSFISFNITAGGGHDGSLMYIMKNSTDSWLPSFKITANIISVPYLTGAVSCNASATNQSWVFYYSRIAYPLTEISYRQHFENDSWSSAVVLISESTLCTDVLARTIHCYPSISNNKIAVLFMDSLAAPYNIKIDYLSFITAQALTYYGIITITFTPSGSGSSWTLPLYGHVNAAFGINSGGTHTSAILGGNILLNFQVAGSPIVEILTKNLIFYGSIVLNFLVNGYTNLPEIPIEMVYAIMAIVVAPSVIGGYLVMRRRRKRAVNETSREE